MATWFFLVCFIRNPINKNAILVGKWIGYNKSKSSLRLKSVIL